MTTVEAALSWAGRSLQGVAERRARRSQRRVAATNAFQQLWNLVLVLGGLTAFTYGAWTASHTLGFFVGGGCLFVLRSIVVWGEKRES